MQFYRKKSIIWNLFEKANIHSIIAPFGLYVPLQNFDFNPAARIIVKQKNKYIEQTKKYSCSIKTLPKIHVKLAIGTNAVLFGSFNFTNSKQQELVCYSEKPDAIEDALDEFDYWWEIANPIKKRMLSEYA